MRTVRALQDEAGPVEAKVFNLVRGLRQEVEDDSAMAPLLRPLRDRAEFILMGMEERTTAGLAAMDLLAALAGEKEAAVGGCGGQRPHTSRIRRLLGAEGTRRAFGLQEPTRST